MSKITAFILFMLSLTFNCWGQQETGCLVFIDSVSPQTTFINRGNPINEKSVRSNDTITSRMGKFEATYDTDDEYLRDGMIHCLRMAMDIWEDKMQITYPLKIHVSASLNMPSSIEVMTKVNYSKVDSFRSRVHSLYKQNYQQTDYVDSIFINANIDWNYSQLSDISEGSNNITTAFLKHIAHILGFGISVTEVNGQLGFTINRTYSDFDNLVVDATGTKLSSLARTGSSSDISDYLTQSIYFASHTNTNKLYSNSNGVDIYRTGKYFSYILAGIMNYPQTPQSEPMKINGKLWTAMDSIGWDIKPHNREITGSNLDQAGYGSLYLFHLYTLSGSGSSYYWKYQSYSFTTKQYTTISTYMGNRFSPSIVGNIGNDEIGPDKCLYRRIVCEVTQDSVTKEYTLPIFLDLHPFFMGCNINNIEHLSGSNYYSMDINFICEGTDSGQISVCNEYAPTRNYHIRGSGIKTIHVDSVFIYGQSYLDIKLNNAYGENVKIIYLENPVAAASMAMPSPSYQTHTEMNGETSDINSNREERVNIRQYGKDITIDLPDMADEVRITGLSGREYFKVSNVGHLSTALPSGMYLLNITRRSNKQTYKINKK